jgi:hypothetical protein
LKDNEKFSKELKCEFVFSLSSLVVPVPLNTDQLKDKLADSDTFSSSESATLEVDPKRLSAKQAMHLVPRILNVAVVKFVRSTGAYFGEIAALKVPVAIRLKSVQDESSPEKEFIKVDIMSPKAEIGSNLLAELRAALSQKQ